MTRISIAPDAVRDAGLTCVRAGDDLQTHAGALRGIALPVMPAAMVAEYSAALGAVAARLVAIVQTLEHAGAELQLRAAAADLADAGGGPGGIAAGEGLSKAVVAGTVLMTGGVVQSTTLTVRPTGVSAVATGAGLRVSVPELVREQGGEVLRTASRADLPDPHDVAQEAAPSSREVEPAAPVEGPPAAAVQQAVAGPADGGAGAAVSGGGAPFDAGSTITGGDQVDPSAANPGLHTAVHDTTAIPVPTDMPDDPDANRQDWACWMAGSAAHQGLPPTLPVMLALSGSGIRNMPTGAHDVGLFGIDPSRTYAPPGHGLPAGSQPSPAWWTDHPEAQLDQVVSRLRGAGGGIRDVELDDAGALSRWASDALPHVDAQRLSDAHDAATAMVDDCKHLSAPSAGGGAHRGGALNIARSQLGVHEVGTNSGPKVDEYLRSAAVGSGNPWCASFVTWSLEQTGHHMPGQGWAAVTNWVQAAQQGQHGLQIVDAAHARPGDIVAYDWGHGSDFSGDGHIGFLDSKVDPSGHFTAVEGNAEDAVTRMDRNLGQANVVFIRAGG